MKLKKIALLLFHVKVIINFCDEFLFFKNLIAIQKNPQGG